MSLLICLTDNAVALFVQLLLFGFHLGFQGSNFFLVLLNFTTLIFDSHTTALQRTEDILKGFVLFTDLFFGLVDDVVWKTKLGGNGKCVTLSWNTDQQTVSRAECFNIKFTAGIFHTWSGECIYLQLTIVGGRHGTDALFVKMGKDCDGKCRTFCRVSTGSELIEKDEGVAVCFLKERNYVGHM